jgi:hypothetical protein
MHSLSDYNTGGVFNGRIFSFGGGSSFGGFRASGKW